MDFSSEIKNELSIAAEVLNNFLNDDNNINSINKAAITMATSIKKGHAVTVAHTVMPCTLRKN